MGKAISNADDFEDKRHQILIKKLKEEFLCPEEEIRKIYLEVLATLREGARIKDFLPLLTSRKVEQLYKSSGLKRIAGK